MPPAAFDNSDYEALRKAVVKLPGLMRTGPTAPLPKAKGKGKAKARGAQQAEEVPYQEQMDETYRELRTNLHDVEHSALTQKALPPFGHLNKDAIGPAEKLFAQLQLTRKSGHRPQEELAQMRGLARSFMQAAHAPRPGAKGPAESSPFMTEKIAEDDDDFEAVDDFDDDENRPKVTVRQSKRIKELEEKEQANRPEYSETVIAAAYKNYVAETYGQLSIKTPENQKKKKKEGDKSAQTLAKKGARAEATPAKKRSMRKPTPRKPAAGKGKKKKGKDGDVDMEDAENDGNMVQKTAKGRGKEVEKDEEDDTDNDSTLVIITAGDEDQEDAEAEVESAAPLGLKPSSPFDREMKGMLGEDDYNRSLDTPDLAPLYPGYDPSQGAWTSDSLTPATVGDEQDDTMDDQGVEV